MTLKGTEFVRITLEALQEIKAEPGGLDEVRTRSTKKRTRRCKKLIEEVLPIAGYLSASGSLDRLSIRWLGGSQGHDAELYGLGPDGPAYVEATTAQHPNAHWQRLHAARTGGAFAPEGIRKDRWTKETISVPVARDATEAHAMFVEQFKVAIDKKAKKVDPSTSALVVLIDGLDVQLDDEMEAFAAALKAVKHSLRELWIVRPADLAAWKVDGPQP